VVRDLAQGRVSVAGPAVEVERVGAVEPTAAEVCGRRGRLLAEEAAAGVWAAESRVVPVVVGARAADLVVEQAPAQAQDLAEGAELVMEAVAAVELVGPAVVEEGADQAVKELAEALVAPVAVVETLAVAERAVQAAQVWEAAEVAELNLENG
jgi:hypothetical protein